MLSILRRNLFTNVNKQGRTFGTTAANNMRFIFLVYDHTDGEALTRRMSVRQKHLEEALPDKRSGFIVSGGAILDSHETKNMLGSSMVFDANSEKEVWDRIHRDIYCTAKVWNMDNCQLIPIIDGFKGLV